MPAQTYSAPAWGQSAYADLELPSGGIVLAKRLDMAAVVAAGLLEEFDALSPEVEEKVVGPAKGKRPADRQPKKLTKAQAAKKEAEQTRKLLQDKDSMESIGRLLALIIPVVIKQPEVHSHIVKDDRGEWTEIAYEDRAEGVTYTDSIPLGDQMHILSWAMEGMDMQEMKQFRSESDESVDGVADVEGDIS